MTDYDPKWIEVRETANHMQVFVCLECGVVVAFPGIHINWHKRHGDSR